jgi:hypothetical protein
MKKFDVEIFEILSKVITVEAEDELEARLLAEEMYRGEEVVLYYSDFQSVEFITLDYEEL